jgi:hypothetical protein
MSVTQFETTPTWQNYVDLTNDVKPFLQIPTTVNPADALLQGIIDMCCWWVQNYLGQPIAPTQFFRRFSGYTGLNGSMINLPYYPVLHLTEVVEYWGLNSGQAQSDSCTVTNNSPNVLDSAAVPAYVGATVTGTGVQAGTTILSVVPGVEFTMSQNYTGSTGTQTLNIQTAGYILREQTPSSQGAPGQQVFQCDYVHGVLIRSFQGLIQRPFFPGLRNVEVTWTAGYNPVPPDIKFATLKLIKHYWNEEEQASRSAPGPRPVGGGYGEGVFAMPDKDRETCLNILSLYQQVGIG